MKVTKAVIPAAGLGTRVLPATKSVPKEMLPIVDRPAIHYIVEEAVRAGITDILIITSRGKSSVEDYFDRAPELEERLLSTGKEDLYRQIMDVTQMANIQYVRQQEAKGLGHAVLCAKSFVGNDPFAVLYGDDVIISPPDQPAIGQLCQAYDRYGLGVVGMKEVTPEQILKYSSLAVEPLEGRAYRVTDMVEKPAPDKVLSLYSILGRCVLPAQVFSILEETPPGAGGELQLTDAMRTLTRSQGMTGVDYIGKRYDMGNKLGVMEAIVEVGLAHPEIGEGFRDYLRRLCKTL
ncbi:MAG: UTP--glucose-1-phosphate uridylyltransferase [Angelakisella sp.]|jgi:UTP--glucose-1-phosphate uridylyltransferase|nr:UTP--glucose-1-phosphate uridylyltransferase [Angelakisella sp.]